MNTFFYPYLPSFPAYYGGIQSFNMTLTPEISDKMLEKNGCNRPLRPDAIDKYARLISSGLWDHNGEAIILAPDGTVLSGQHRLYGCVKANVPFTTVVTRGVAKENFRSMDSGIPRSMRDVLSVLGEARPGPLASAIGCLYRYETGTFRQSKKGSNVDFDVFFHRHPGVRDAVAISSTLHKPFQITPVAALTYLGSLIDPDFTVNFLKELNTGENLSKGSPALALRTALLSGVNGATPGNNRVLFRRLFLCTKAFNAALQGNSVLQLRVGEEEKYRGVRGLPYGEPLFEVGEIRMIA